MERGEKRHPLLSLEGNLAWMSDHLDFFPGFITKVIITTQVKIDPEQIQPLCEAYTFLVEKIKL